MKRVWKAMDQRIAELDLEAFEIFTSFNVMHQLMEQGKEQGIDSKPSPTGGFQFRLPGREWSAPIQIDKRLPRWTFKIVKTEGTPNTWRKRND